MQYSTNVTQTDNAQDTDHDVQKECNTENMAPSNDEDDEVETLIAMLANAKFKVNKALNVRAHTNYLAMLVHIDIQLCIPDGGADSHVCGSHWLILCPIIGPGYAL